MAIYMAIYMPYMVIYGYVWPYVAICGHKWSYMATYTTIKGI